MFIYTPHVSVHFLDSLCSFAVGLVRCCVVLGTDCFASVSAMVGEAAHSHQRTVASYLMFSLVPHHPFIAAAFLRSTCCTFRSCQASLQQACPISGLFIALGAAITVMVCGASTFKLCMRCTLGVGMSSQSGCGACRRHALTLMMQQPQLLSFAPTPAGVQWLGAPSSAGGLS
jgi:hypothetical protein